MTAPHYIAALKSVALGSLLTALGVRLMAQAVQMVQMMPNTWQHDLIAQSPTILTSVGTLATIIIGGIKLIRGQKEAADQKHETDMEQKAAVEKVAEEQKKTTERIAKAVTVAADKVAGQVSTVASTAAEVAQAQADLNAKVLAITRETHILVNGQHGMALATILQQAIQINLLDPTTKHSQDVVNAKQKLTEHEAKQSLIIAAGADVSAAAVQKVVEKVVDKAVDKVTTVAEELGAKLDGKL